MKSEKIITVCTALKYLFSLILTFLTFSVIEQKRYILVCLLEISIILLISNILMKKKIVGQIINDVLMFLYNAQIAVMMFGSSYITLVMLANIPSLKALSGKAGVYILAAVLVLVFSCLPIRRFEGKEITPYCLLSGALCLELGFTMIFGNGYSPMYGYCDLIFQEYDRVQMAKSVETMAEPTDGQVEALYREGVADFRKKSSMLTKQPNVILIFTEGLSQSVISDERNLMPNVAEYQQRSLNFIDYYNHTFATYLSLNGQLYSGYQLNNLEANPLISIQSVLSDQGYQTAFINTEPNNEDFTNYLNQMGFDEVIGSGYECNGMAASISDKNAYELLFDSAMEKSESEAPFFLAIYTFGTHASLDSTDELYEDGTDPEINKFYNVDQHFGTFMEKYRDSSLFEDTIIIFTADHATYTDDAFVNSFPDYPRAATSIDKIPLFIYHQGIEPESKSVCGRNSVCLVPTILDYLDISAPNYFLGTSLFADQVGSAYETSYNDSFMSYTTKNNVVEQMEEKELAEFNSLLQDYHMVKATVEAS